MFKKYSPLVLATLLGIGTFAISGTRASATALPYVQQNATDVSQDNNPLLQEVSSRGGDRMWSGRRGSGGWGNNHRSSGGWGHNRRPYGFNKGYNNRRHSGYWKNNGHHGGSWNNHGHHGGNWNNHGHHGGNWNNHGFGFWGLPYVSYYPGFGSYYGYGGGGHIDWCLNRYRSYNPYSNTWVGHSGRIYQCRSPFWY
jgi:hypothetical protein